MQRPYLTVVSGAPRSGTSMMMRMLAEGGIEPMTDGAREADRDNPAGYYEFEAVKRLREDKSWVPDAVGRSVKMVHLLLKELPPGQEYRVVLMRRHVGEMVASQRKMLERLGRPVWKLPDGRMAEIFTAQLDETETWLASTPGFSHLVMDYNALLTDARPGLERLANFLGGRLDVDRMCAVVDPSLYRNRG